MKTLWIFGLAVVVGLMRIVPWPTLIDWTDDHSGAAGWVQGIGSIVAIVSAAWIAAGEARDRRNRDKLELARRVHAQFTLINLARVYVEEAADALGQLVHVKGPLGVLQKLDPTDAVDRVASAKVAIQQFPFQEVELSRVIEILGAVIGALNTGLGAASSTPAKVPLLNGAKERADNARRALQELGLRGWQEISDDLEGRARLMEKVVRVF